MIEHKLKLKFDDSFNGILFSTQGDTGRVFEVEVRDELNNAIDIACHKLEFYVGNEKKVTKVEASIQGNKFVVRPVNEQFTKAGLNKAQFVLYDPQGLQVGSQIFDLHVEESIQQGATVGSNVVVDFGILQEALKLIKGYEKTFEESKGLDATLNASIKEGRKVDQALKSDTSAARGVDANLKTSTTKAGETYTKLEATRTSSDTLNTDLEGNISQGNKTNSNLQSSIGTANNTQNSLQDKTAQGIEINTKLGQSIKTGQGIVSNIATADRGLASTIASANTSKINLDSSISKAETSKSNLDGSIAAANTAKKNLDESTSKGNTTNSNLKSTDSKAGTSISTLQDLLNKSATTEQSLKEIIASGNLDKYVTTPKLEEALAKIKTLKKEVVNALPQTGKDDVIYLVKDSKGKANNVYLEYLWINGAFELIGSTEVDLSGYMKEAVFYETWNDFLTEANKNIIDTNVKLSKKIDETQITNEYALDDTTKVPSSKALYDALNLMDDAKVNKVDGKGLSSNDYTNADKTKLKSINLKKYLPKEDFTHYAQANEGTVLGLNNRIDSTIQMLDTMNSQLKDASADANQSLQVATNAMIEINALKGINTPIPVVFYMNQFFGAIGGEEQADMEPIVTDEVKGPALYFTRNMPLLTHYKTIICGDNYIVNNAEALKAIVGRVLSEKRKVLFIACPSFNSSRYSIANLQLCDYVQSVLRIPAVTGMYIDAYNQVTSLDDFKINYCNHLNIVSTKNSAAGMRDALSKIARIGIAKYQGEKLTDEEKSWLLYK